MATVVHVKKAQQRYETSTVTNPDGSPKRVPVMASDGVTQKTSKHGPIFRTITVEDKTKPLPNRTCDKCRKEIEVGQPYKWIAPKSGPYGGTKRFRCGDCPTWNIWEYSSSLGARTAEIAYNFQEVFAGLDPTGGEIDEDFDGASILEEVKSALSDAAESIREIAQEKRDGASNIEDGFGHATAQSEELSDVADQLESWADDVEDPNLPDLEFPECEVCGGSGEVSVATGKGLVPSTCDDCGGTGEDREARGQAVSDWWSEVESVCSIVDECPV